MTPCSPPSRRGLARPQRLSPPARRPALTASARGVPALAGRDEERRVTGPRDGIAALHRNPPPRRRWASARDAEDQFARGAQRLSPPYGPVSEKARFFVPTHAFAFGLVSRRGQGWPLRCWCGVRRRFQATP